MTLMAVEVFTPNEFPVHTYVNRQDERLEERLGNALRTPQGGGLGLRAFEVGEDGAGREASGERQTDESRLNVRGSRLSGDDGGYHPSELHH
jgi:hypothetical protein